MNRLGQCQAHPPVASTPDCIRQYRASCPPSAERISQSPLTAGNRLTVLEGGDQAYPEMLAAIRGAQQLDRHESPTSSATMRRGGNSARRPDRSRPARRRGAGAAGRGRGPAIFTPGNLLSHAPCGRDRGALSAHLAALAHAVSQYAQPPQIAGGGWQASAFWAASISGRKIARGRPVPSAASEDVHFKVEGPVVRVVMDTFARDWTFTTEESLDEDIWWPKLEPAGTVFARGLRSGPDADLYKLELILGAAITLARKADPHRHALFPARRAAAVRHRSRPGCAAWRWRSWCRLASDQR